MKSRTSHLIHLLVWLLVLTAYVVVLNGLPQAPVFCSHPCGVGWDCRGPGVVGLSDHEETRGLSVPIHLSFSIFARSKWARLGTTPLFPGGPCSFGETADRPAESQTPQGRSASMTPVFFPAQGGRRCWAWVRF